MGFGGFQGFKVFRRLLRHLETLEAKDGEVVPPQNSIWLQGDYYKPAVSVSALSFVSLPLEAYEKSPAKV